MDLFIVVLLFICALIFIPGAATLTQRAIFTALAATKLITMLR